MGKSMELTNPQSSNGRSQRVPECLNRLKTSLASNSKVRTVHTQPSLARSSILAFMMVERLTLQYSKRVSEL